MIDENDDAAGVESEVASTDLHSVIADAVAAQKAPQDEAPVVKESLTTDQGEETDKAPREDGRDEKGRFAPKEPKAEAATEEPAAPVEAEGDQPKEPDAPAYRPPDRWPVKAKSLFNEIPEEVKQAIAAREEEVNAGFARYAGLRKFTEIAERNGTTLANAVSDYARLEDQFRTDPVAGVDAICARFGIPPNRFFQAYAARHGVDLSGQQATNMGHQQPYVDQAAHMGNQNPYVDVDAIVDQKLAVRETKAQIEEFSRNPQNQFFANVREDMAILIQSGKAQTLQEAYDRACWMDPEIRAILLKSQTPNATPPNVAAIQKAKAAAKAVGGAPSPGFKPDVKTIDPSKMSIMDNIKHAIAQQR